MVSALGIATAPGLGRAADEIRGEYPLGTPAVRRFAVARVRHRAISAPPDRTPSTARVSASTDVGRPFVQYEKPRTWLNSADWDHGLLGPGSDGRKSAARRRGVVIDGDGCFQMTNQSSPPVRSRAPIKVALINNGNLGMVRQWQTLFYEQRYSQTDLSTTRMHPDSSGSARPWAGRAACERAEDVDEVIAGPRDQRPAGAHRLHRGQTPRCGRWSRPNVQRRDHGGPGHPAAVRRRRLRCGRAGGDPRGDRADRCRCARRQEEDQ